VTSKEAAAAAEVFVEAVYRYVDDGAVDLVPPVDALISAARGRANDDAIAEVLNEATAILAANDVLRGGSHLGPGVRRKADKPSMRRLHASVFRLHTLNSQDEGLRRAEEQVAALEAQVASAQERLEQAVTAGDVTEVLNLRLETRVTLPGKLGEARTRLLELQLAAAESLLTPAHGYDEDTMPPARAAYAAEKAAAIEGVLQETVDERKAALEAHRTSHEHDQRTRIRQLAGLDPAL
jgi:hypothetical protein